VAVGAITPGINGQCVNTTGSSSVWGSCAGTAGVQLISVNNTAAGVAGNTTATQALQAACVTAPCYVAGALNFVGKTFDFQEVGLYQSVNTSQTIFLNVSFNGGSTFPLTVISFTPTSTSVGYFSTDMTCTVIANGTTGILNCRVVATVTDGAGHIFNGPTYEVQTGVNLTLGITPQLGVAFTTASTTNQGNGLYAITHQHN
jgi:hypothetical protein